MFVPTHLHRETLPKDMREALSTLNIDQLKGKCPMTSNSFLCSEKLYQTFVDSIACGVLSPQIRRGDTPTTNTLKEHAIRSRMQAIVR